jgi:diadenylate cyclase
VLDTIFSFVGATNWLSLVVTVLDFAIVYYLIYRILLLIKGTRAVQMLIGLLAIIIIFSASKEEYFDLPALHWLLDTFISSFILIIIVIFQDDIRRGLSQVGTSSILSAISTRQETQLIEEVVKASSQIAAEHRGALIVIEREADLGPIADSGIGLDAKVTKELLVSIFHGENPLHDGAVVIRSDRVQSAGCILPLTNTPGVDPSLGTRHRAALGLSEETDAAIVVVSEETGIISVSYRDELIRGLDATSLRELLHRIFAYHAGEKAEERRRPVLRWLRSLPNRRADSADDSTDRAESET